MKAQTPAAAASPGDKNTHRSHGIEWVPGPDAPQSSYFPAEGTRGLQTDHAPATPRPDSGNILLQSPLAGKENDARFKPHGLFLSGNCRKITARNLHAKACADIVKDHAGTEIFLQSGCTSVSPPPSK
jgi:hypothetical protein